MSWSALNLRESCSKIKPLCVTTNLRDNLRNNLRNNLRRPLRCGLSVARVATNSCGLEAATSVWESATMVALLLASRQISWRVMRHHSGPTAAETVAEEKDPRVIAGKSSGKRIEIGGSGKSVKCQHEPRSSTRVVCACNSLACTPPGHMASHGQNIPMQ